MRRWTILWTTVTFVAVVFSLGCAEDAPLPSPLRPPDHPEFTVRSRQRDAGEIVWDVRTGEGRAIGLSRWTVGHALQRAAAVWGGAGAIGFRRARGGEPPDLIVTWHEGHRAECEPFLDWEGSVAHAGPVVRPTYIHLDAAARWSQDGDDGIGLYQTLLHELGHVLGLDHTRDETAVMYGGYDRRRRRLAESDLAGLHSLYGGGLDGAGDLVFRDADTGARRTDAIVLRRVAPPGRVGWTVLDVDGDGRDDLLTWPLAKGALPEITSYHFGYACRLESTRGPRISVVDPRRAIFGTADGAAVAVLLGDAGRYSAFRLGDEGLPRTAWPAGAPLVLECGVADRDGDGVLDAQSAGPARMSVGDFDGDGRDEELAPER